MKASLSKPLLGACRPLTPAGSGAPSRWVAWSCRATVSPILLQTADHLEEVHELWTEALHNLSGPVLP